MVEVVTVLMMVVVWTVSWPQRWRERCPGIARYYSLSSPPFLHFSSPRLSTPPPPPFPLPLRLFPCTTWSRFLSLPPSLPSLSLSLSSSVLLGQAFSPAFPRSFYRGLPRATLPRWLINMAVGPARPPSTSRQRRRGQSYPRRIRGFVRASANVVFSAWCREISLGEGRTFLCVALVGIGPLFISFSPIN